MTVSQAPKPENEPRALTSSVVRREQQVGLPVGDVGEDGLAGGRAVHGGRDLDELGEASRAQSADEAVEDSGVDALRHGHGGSQGSETEDGRVSHVRAGVKVREGERAGGTQDEREAGWGRTRSYIGKKWRLG